MADTKFTVDYSDIKALHAELGKTSKEFQNMVRSVDPVVNATETFSRKVDLLNAEFKESERNGKLYQRTLDNIRKQANLAGVSLDKFGRIQAVGGKSSKQFQLQVQQAGYQVGDFFTQVAMGQNPIMAFSTQMSQLAGFFSGPWGAAIGAGISIVGALSIAFMNTRESAKDLDTAIKDLDGAVSSYIESLVLARSGTAGLVEQFGLATPELRSVVRDLALIERSRAYRALDDLGESLNDFLDGFEGRYQNTLDLLQNPDLGGFRSFSRETQGIVTSFDSLTAKMRDSVDLGERLQAALDLRDLFLANITDQNKMTVEQESFLEGLLKSIQNLQILQEETKVVATEMGHNVYLTEELNRNILGLDFSGAIAGATTLANRLGAAAQSAMDTLEAIGKAGGRRLTEEQNLSLAQMELSMRKSGATEAQIAGQLAGMREGYKLEGQNIPEALIRQQKNLAATNAEQLALAQMEISGLRKTEGGSKTETTPYIKQLLAEADHKRKIVGLSDQEVRRREIMFELSKREEVASEAQIEQIIKLEEETRKLTEAQTQAERQQKAFTDILMDGMESLITGSKSVEDAFKDTIRNILLDVYRTQVLKPLATAGSDFLLNMFKADGGAFNRGVQMYADGGVVSSPTMFGHSGGLGVMGEAGPEAIMPLKRGANGKLGVQMEGGSGAISVVNNITVNGNDNPAAVRAELAKLMPQIEKATINSVINARKRGGQMKAAFR